MRGRVKLNLACGPRHLDGFENLDLTNGWRFQDGLPYADGSVEAITESHGLYLLPIADWPHAFAEIARVLEPGGVVRITEDATDDRRSSRYGGFDGWVTLTSRGLVSVHLEAAGLDVKDCSPEWSYFKNGTDGSLIQEWHGEPPKVFHVEGIKQPNFEHERSRLR